MAKYNNISYQKVIILHGREGFDVVQMLQRRECHVPRHNKNLENERIHFNFIVHGWL